MKKILLLRLLINVMIKHKTISEMMGVLVDLP